MQTGQNKDQRSTEKKKERVIKEIITKTINETVRQVEKKNVEERRRKEKELHVLEIGRLLSGNSLASTKPDSVPSSLF